MMSSSAEFGDVRSPHDHDDNNNDQKKQKQEKELTPNKINAQRIIWKIKK